MHPTTSGKDRCLHGDHLGLGEPTGLARLFAFAERLPGDVHSIVLMSLSNGTHEELKAFSLSNCAAL
jgi:hypothetical protein